MKLRLTYGQISSEAFLTGFALISNLPLGPDEVCWLSKSLDKIQDELKHYNKARLALFKKWGQQIGEDEWRIDPAADNRRFANYDFETLHARTLEITLVRKIQLPKKIEISAAQHNALRDAGIIEALQSGEPKEEEPAEKKANPAETPNPKPETVPPPSHNGEFKRAKPKARITDRKASEPINPQPSTLN